MKTYADLTETQKELFLFTYNSGSIYGIRQAVERRFSKKICNGTFDLAKAPAAYKSFVNAGAAEYYRIFSGDEQKTCFSADDRRAVCEALAANFNDKISCGDIDFSVWTVSGLKKNPLFMGKNPYFFERGTMRFFGNRLAETKILYVGTFVNIHGERVPVFNVQTVNHGKYFDGESVDHFYNLNTFQREFKGGLKKWKNLR
jgi:hypothetical protein